jgi:Carboxypeptidase regulatory-like domain
MLRRILALSLALALLYVAPAYAAITGVISGTVTDPSGAVLPNVTVLAMNEETGIKSTVVSDSKGFYSFPALDVGLYTITATATSFNTFSEEHIRIDANSSVRADIKLTVGSVAITEQVIANPVTVETQSSQVGEVISGEQMTAVPLNGRSFTDLLSLQANVSPIAVETGNTPSPSGSLDTGNVSINGGRGASNAFMVNGGDVDDGVENATAVVPNLDSIAEFRIITNNFDAEYGNYSGGQVNVVTKNGTNQFHGSGFDFIRNTAFNARGYSFSNPAPPKGSYDQNIYGGTFGGPIKRNKLFFFGDYQGTDQVIGTSDSATVVSANDLAGNVSDWAPLIAKDGQDVQGSGWAQVLTKRLGYTVNAGEPYFSSTCTSNTQCVFPSYIIPKTAWDPAASKLMKYIQPANSTVSNAGFVGGAAPAYSTTAFNDTLLDNKEATRIDWATHFGTFFAYYFMDNDHTLNPFAGGSDGGFGAGTTQRVQMANLGLTTTFRNDAVNDARFTYLRSAAHENNPTYAVPGPSLNSLGFVTPWSSATGGLGNVSAGLTGVPGVSIPEGGGFGTPSQIEGRYVNSFQWLDNWMKVIGKHTISIGGNYSYNQIDERTYYDVNGGFGFADDNETGLGFADFLLGAADTFAQASPQTLDSRSHFVGAYVEDSWRAASNLTLNYGLRYEISTPWYDTQNKLETIIPGEQSVVFPGAPIGWVFPGDPGVPRTLAPIKYNKIAPRFGFAYSPTAVSGLLSKIGGGANNFSIRGSFGIFYTNFQDESGFVEVGDAPYGLFYSAPTQSLLSAPYIDRGTQNIETAKFPFPFPPTNVSPSNPDNNICWACYEPLSTSYAVGVHNTIPYIEAYYLGVQRGFGKSTVLEVNYVGNQGRHLADLQEANPGNPTTCLALDSAADVKAGTTPCGPHLESNKFTAANGTVYQGTRPLGQPNGLAFGTNPYINTNAISNYNSLQLTLRHTGSIWTGLVGYTWGRSFDDASTMIDYANPFNSGLTYGLSQYNIDRNFVASYEVHLPFNRLSGNAVLRQIAGGWSLSGITHMYSGVPVAMSDSEDYSLTGASGVDFPYYKSGNVRQGQHNPRVKPVQPYFNTTLFTPEGKECSVKTACYGVPGNSKRRFFAGPGTQYTDLALLRDFHIKERNTVQFRLEAFDFANHANFAAPNGSVTASTFGEITGAASANASRILQVAVKYEF